LMHFFYGLQKSPRLWFEPFNKNLLEIKFI
jgi:hypothetical protein